MGSGGVLVGLYLVSKNEKKKEKKEKEKKEKNKKKGGKKGIESEIRLKKLETKIGKNIRFEGILRRERVCCSEHGATAWPILHTASTLRSL